MSITETYRCDICNKKVKDEKDLTTIYENTHIYISGAFGSNGGDVIEKTDMCSVCKQKMKVWLKNNKKTGVS